MRSALALLVTASLTLASIPGSAHPGPSKPVTAGPKSPKGPKVVATATPKSRPATAGPKTAAPKTTGPKASASAATTKSPKSPKSPKVTTTTAQSDVTTQVPKTNVPKNPKLAARLQAMLPVGMTIEQAALGFKNQGQFIAALKVSQNLGLSFVDLKSSMVDGGLSLGQSIQQLKPALDADVEASRATQWASQQLEEPR